MPSTNGFDSRRCASGARVHPREGQHLAHEGADRGHVRPTAHGDDLDGTGDLRVDQRAHTQARHGDGILGDEGDSQPGQRHALHPVVAIAAKDDDHLGAVLAEQLAGVIEEFALHPVEVMLAIEILGAHPVLLVEGVPRPDPDHEALVVQAARMKALVDFLRLAVDRDVEFALGQALLKLLARSVLDDQPHLGMTLAEGLQEGHEAARADGAHHAELELDVLQPAKALGALLGGLGLDQHLAEMGAHHLAQSRQMRVVALPAEQRAAQLVLQPLDGARQRRLRDVARLGRAGEIQSLANREKVADLMHFHGGGPPDAGDYAPDHHSLRLSISRPEGISRRPRRPAHSCYMTLTQTLLELSRHHRAALSARDRADFEDELDRLRMMRVAEEGLRLGEYLPDFALEDGVGRTWTSGELLDRGPLVLALFRGDWCPYCDLTMAALEEARPAIEALGATAVGI